MTKRFSLPAKLILCILAGILVLGVAWFLIPKSAQMQMRPDYYLWSKGFLPLTQERYETFQKDSEYRYTLRGKPLKVLRDRFPDMRAGSDYSPKSYRGKVSEYHLNHDEEPAECYWLNGKGSKVSFEEEANRWGYFVLVKDGQILRFDMAKIWQRAD